MRKYGRVDANHTAIITALRQAGITAFSIASIGNGKGDIVAGYQGINVLLEVKNPKQEPRKQRLTRDEIRHHREWNGQIAVVKTAEEAIAAVMTAMRQLYWHPNRQTRNQLTPLPKEE